MDFKKNESLEGKDLEEIGCHSLMCKLSMKELIHLFKLLGIKYREEHIRKIQDYRLYLQKHTRSPALGF